MEWNVGKITEELKALSERMGDEFDIPVSVNGRLTRSLGRTFHTYDSKGFAAPLKMDFSKSFLDSATSKNIIEVIKHEWAHYYLVKTTGKSHGHDYLFKVLCAKIGAPGETKIKVEYINAENHNKPKQYKYELFCTDCGKMVGGYSTSAAKAVKNPEQYTSGCCHAKLRLVQNW